MATAFAQGVSLLTSLVSIPLTLNYLGLERFGMWLTISSIIAFFGFADLGMGAGLLNAVADAHGRDDRAAAREYVSSAFYMLCVLALVLGVVFFSLYPRIDWHMVLNVSSPQAVAESGTAVAVLAVCFLLGIPLGVVNRTRMGYQQGFLNTLWQASGNLLGLAAILVSINLRAGLPQLVLAMAGTPVLVTYLSGAYLFYKERPWLRPNRRAVQMPAVQQILRLGTLFFVLQIAGALGFQTDNLIIAHFLGAAQVSQYAVPMRLFSIIPMMLGLALTPLWPAYVEAIARHDVEWVQRTFRRFLGVSLAVSLMFVAILLGASSFILRIWVGDSIQPTWTLLLGLGGWALLNSISGSLAMLFNAANAIVFQIILALSMGITNLVLSIVLVQWIGLPGPVYGSIIAVLLCSIIPAWLYTPRLFARLSATTPTSQHLAST